MATWLFLIRMRSGCHALEHWYLSSCYVYILPKSENFPILTFHLLFYQITTDRDGTGGGEDVWQFADPRQAQRPQHAHQPNSAT